MCWGDSARYNHMEILSNIMISVAVIHDDWLILGTARHLVVKDLPSQRSLNLRFELWSGTNAWLFIILKSDFGENKEKFTKVFIVR